MSKVLGNLIAQFNQFFKNLPPVKRASMVAAGSIALIAAVVVSLMVGGTNYDVLFHNITTDKLPLIISTLEKKNIPFQIGSDGQSILVPGTLLHSTQMSLMSELSSSDIGNIGLELFEKQDFGVTSYAQRVNYQRALQGELIRSINTLTSVKRSKVILALPPKKTFLEESGEPTASVILELHEGKKLGEEQIRGIVHLVASSVENLDPEKVTVIDSRGKVLSRHFSSEGQMSAELLDMKAKMELGISERIESILSRVVGSGRVIAQVNVSLNPQYITTREEQVDPDAVALSSSSREEELLDGSRTNPAGIPGARANLPGAQDGGQVGFQQNVKRELSQESYTVPKTVRNIKEGAGRLQKISVAVLVDGKNQVVNGDGGESQWVPRSPEEMTKYENIVKNAIGFDASRGDSVKIVNEQFVEEDFEQSEKILTQLERRKLLHALFKWSLLGFSLALFFFIVVRPFMSWITDSFQDTVEDMLPRTIEELEELQSVDNSLPGMSGALPVLEESLDPDKAESELLKERIMALITDDEEKASGAFSLWLARRDS